MKTGLICQFTDNATVASLLHLPRTPLSLVKLGFVALLRLFCGNKESGARSPAIPRFVSQRFLSAAGVLVLRLGGAVASVICQRFATFVHNLTGYGVCDLFVIPVLHAIN
jgi:hypothetical protein